MSDVLLESALPFPCRRGKVRDVYDVGEHLLLVATDRISAYDCVMPNGIPGKGKILTQLSLFWFDRTVSIVPNHLVARDVADFPRALRSFGDQLIGRSVLVKKTKVVPVECVARGYLAGSGWAEYRQSGTLAGQPLPRGLKQADRLPTPQFTPATKAEQGHDENISFVQMGRDVGVDLASQLRDLTLTIYFHAAAYAAERGVILADTKLEFGHLPNGQLIVIDEMLTPDSSRFWPADRYQPGREPPSFDKQFVRDYLTAQPWNKQPPAPALPSDVVAGTRQRYVEAYEKLTGRPWRD
ncbi:MAG TPA: phosphoribosylaminoimidazolesuccinocarboxamide synthase [Tepidisphaeraceae bacterium]